MDTDESITIKSGDYRAVIGSTGAALCALTWRGHDLVLGHEPSAAPQAFEGHVLSPWPNRIDHGRYRWEGSTHQLHITEPQHHNAIHGLIHGVRWELAAKEPERATLAYRLADAPGYPFTLELTVGYEVSADSGLAIAITARNAGSTPAPYGNGTHNYLTLGAEVDSAELALPASRYLPTGERLLPSARPLDVSGTAYDFRVPRRIGGFKFDTPFTGLTRAADQRSWVVLGADGSRVALWADASYRWLQVFSGDGLPAGMHRRGLAVEPMTCPPNAFASGRDLITLSPGETTRSRLGIQRLTRG